MSNPDTLIAFVLSYYLEPFQKFAKCGKSVLTQFLWMGVHKNV